MAACLFVVKTGDRGRKDDYSPGLKEEASGKSKLDGNEKDSRCKSVIGGVARIKTWRERQWCVVV